MLLKARLDMRRGESRDFGLASPKAQQLQLGVGRNCLFKIVPQSSGARGDHRFKIVPQILTH